jgi:diguanylate cyclase (GGDEF)-like protein
VSRPSLAGGSPDRRRRWITLRAWVLGLGLPRALAVLTAGVWAASLCITYLVQVVLERGSLALGMAIASLCVVTIAPVVGYVVLRLLYELESSRQQIRQLAITDELTDSYNRRYFMEAAEVELLRARRYEAPLSLILIDVDHFKRVNDTHGHQCGDALLREIAQACRDGLRGTDLVARFGGEELIVLLPQTGLAGALTMAERIRERVAQLAIQWREQKVEATVSLGVAALRADTPTLDALIHEADIALYDAKRSGRNRVCGWNADRRMLADAQAT